MAALSRPMSALHERSLLTCGMGYGDEGKGGFVDWLAQGDDAVTVKYNGGAQASHTVVTPNGTVHRFAQLGSGMFHPGSKTVLDENFTVDPFSLAVECEVFAEKAGLSAQQVVDRVTVHDNCLTVTRLHRCLNRVEMEQAGGRRSSVGTGVSTAARVWERHGVGLRVKELWQPVLRERLEQLQEMLAQRLADGTDAYSAALVAEIERVSGRSGMEHLLREYDRLFRCCRFRTAAEPLCGDGRRIILEGSQGLLLDKRYGIPPHTTALDTTALWGKRAYAGARAIGIVKAFATRHGVGVFPTEDAALSSVFDDPHQEVGRYNGRIRLGWFDAVLTRYAQRVNGVDELYLSCLDRLTGVPESRICVGYIYPGVHGEDFSELFAWEPAAEGACIRDILCMRDAVSEYLSRCVPVYVRQEGWVEDISGARRQEDLPAACHRYIEAIEVQTGLPVTAIAVGPDRLKRFERK